MATDEILSKAIARTAFKVCRNYRHIQREDLEQDIWAQVLEDRQRLEALADAEMAEALRRLAWRICREDERHRRSVKAAEAGYELQDEQYYSQGLLRQIIPAWLDNGVQEHPPAGREMTPGSRSDPGTRGTWLAAMEDISEAMRRVKPYHRNILERYFQYPRGRGGWTHLEIAGALGINESTLYHRIGKALAALQRELGGANPWRKPGKRPACCELETCPQHRQQALYEMQHAREDMERRRAERSKDG